MIFLFFSLNTGKDILGESILVCTKLNARSGQELIATALKPVSSSLDADDYAHFKRALLEIISSGMASTRDELELFVSRTLYCQQHNIDFSYLKTSSDEFKTFVESKTLGKDIYRENDAKEVKGNDPIKKALNFLFEYSFIRLHDDDEGEVKLVPTRLGIACLSSSMPPKDGFLLFQELQKARQNFVLECDLHALYLVTPFSVAYQLQQIDWTHFVDLYDKLPSDQKRVAQMVGVSDTFLIKAITGRQNSDWHAQQVHKRLDEMTSFVNDRLKKI
jgi:DNA polymerase theta